MTTHEHIDPDRLWILRAARGEIDTPAAHDTVRAMHHAVNLSTTDPELHQAMLDGDAAHPERTKWPDDTPAWLHDVEADPATTEAFDQLVDQLDDEYQPEWAALIVDGKTWLTSGPDHPDPLWGNLGQILAVKGQPTTIAGPQGAGKSVFGQKLALGHIGIINQLLGLDITPGQRNALYLASDRPEQARLSMRRMITPDHHDTLETRLRIWKGPPPEDVAKQPLMLLEMAQAADADLIIIDSAKDVALKLSADEIGAAYNSALQHCVANQIDVIALHHPRKLSGDTRDNPVRVLDDLYGAYWITAGNGSVIYLQPGDFETYTLTQLKSPIGHKAEIPYEHHTPTGDVRSPTAPTLESVLAGAGYDGLGGKHAANCLYRRDATGAEVKKVLRALHDMVDQGIAEVIGGSTRNRRWRLTDDDSDTLGVSESPPAHLSEPIETTRLESLLSDSDTTDSDTSHPPYKGGGCPNTDSTPTTNPLDELF